MPGATQALEISMWETVLFFGLAAIMIILAVYGLLITRRAVYSAACVIANMVCLAFLYTMLEAPFMGVVQVAVYTGAILMMFLFVLMMIGVDSSDSTHETLRTQRPVAILGGLGFVVILGGAILGAVTPDAVGMEGANEPTNPQAIAQVIFGNHVLAMELTGTLLIVAALGAMTLTHRERTRKKYTQEELVDAKMEAYSKIGRHIGQKPPTGVFAESNSAANPALTAGGVELEESVPRVLRVRGQGRRLSEISPVTAARVARGEFGRVQADVPLSTLPGMPGEEAPVYPSGTSSPQIESGPPDDGVSQGAIEDSENNEQEESK
ncbi:NADH-quinone oxidoreductase subunit J [Actinomycetaceae bacterium L2_0104]